MKEYYLKRIEDYQKSAQDLELKAEKEKREGSGAQAMSYLKLADYQKEEAKKYREALDKL